MKFFIKELEEGNDKLHISGRLNPDIHEYAKEFPEDINVDLHFSRFNQNVSANISIKTVGHFVCDRCLTSFDREISEEASIFFRLIFGGEYSDLDEEEDVVCLREDEKEYDLSDFISEQLGLTLPIRNICKDDCKGLCSVCGIDLNNMQCECAGENFDHRLEMLKQIKNNLEGK